MSIISHQDLNSEVLLSLLPMAPGLVSKNWGPGLQDVPSTSELDDAQQGYLFRFWFSHATVYIWQQWQVYGKGNEIQKAKGHFLLLSYTRARQAAWLQDPWHQRLGRTSQLSWNLAERGSQAGVWLRVSVQAEPGLAVHGRSKDNIPKESWAVSWHVLQAG